MNDAVTLKKGQTIKINMFGNEVETVQIMDIFNISNVGEFNFVCLKTQKGAPYTISITKLKKVIVLL
jgi:hypothetical protein